MKNPFSAMSAGVDFLMQERAMDWQSDEASFSRDWSANQAAHKREWDERMRATQYQTSVQDLIAAGLNPMLGFHGGGAGMPSGATAQSAQPSGVQPLRYTQSLNNAAQTEVLLEQADNIKAQTDKAKAETQEIQARTPTHAVSIQQMQANIDKVTVEMAKILQETETSAASAANIEQQTINLRAILPQIEATIANLRAQNIQLSAQTRLTTAQTTQTHAQTGLTKEQEREVSQRIRANLPAAEAALLKVQEALKNLERPKAGMRAATYSSWVGAVGEMLNALNPLRGLFGN